MLIQLIELFQLFTIRNDNSINILIYAYFAAHTHISIGCKIVKLSTPLFPLFKAISGWHV